MNVGELGEALRKARDLVSDLDAKLKRAKRDQAEAEEKLLEAMVENGLQGMKLSDGSTVYIRRDLFVSKKKEWDTESILDYLRKFDLDFCVRETFVPATLKSFVVEREKELRDGDPDVPIEEALPEGFTTYFNVTEKLRPIVRAAVKK